MRGFDGKRVALGGEPFFLLGSPRGARAVDPGFIKHTRELFRRKFGHDPSEEEVRASVENLRGFFEVLSEWERKSDEKSSAKNTTKEKSRKVTSGG